MRVLEKSISEFPSRAKILKSKGSGDKAIQVFRTEGIDRHTYCNVSPQDRAVHLSTRAISDRNVTPTLPTTHPHMHTQTPTATGYLLGEPTHSLNTQT